MNYKVEAINENGHYHGRRVANLIEALRWVIDEMEASGTIGARIMRAATDKDPELPVFRANRQNGDWIVW
jgi:hypothetical protein